MLTCRQCRRANPDSAAYCWYDGVHLGSPDHPAGPVADAPVRRFNPPLVLRSGISIATFPDLARLAPAHWEELLAALRDGSLEKLFRRIQREDLAQRAAWAAKHVDPEQALDELLDRLPGVRRQPARLEIEPLDVDLGSISRTTPRTVTLRLHNRGQGLLMGTVRVEGAAWLSVGDAAGVQQKLFRCPEELTLTVRVVGKALRTSSRPVEGKLVVDSNGGTFEIPVRATVPVVPFGEGVLSGATSPGALAEKARLAPKEAAALFERGLVVAWYEANGWIYPVRGPIAEGLGAVQQFFEALGRAVPPQVSISETRIELRGAPGESLQSKVVLSTTEQRTVYGHGVSQADWLEVGRPSLDGQRATLPLRVRRVPDRPNERLRTSVEVGANGGQKFQVEVILHVLPGAARKVAPDTLDAPPDWLFADTPAAVPVPTREPVRKTPEKKPQQQPQQRKPAPDAPVVVEWAPVMPSTTPQTEPVPIPVPVATATPTATPQPTYNPSPATRPRLAPAAEPEAEDDDGDPGLRLLAVLLPLVLLGVGLGGLILHDLWLPDKVEPKPPEIVIEEEPVDPKAYVKLDFNDARKDELPVDPNMMFGLAMTQAMDPRKPGRFKQLVYDQYGRTNNVCIKVDDRPSLFGVTTGGRWVTMSEALPGDPSPGRRSVWRTPDGNVEVTQEVEVLRGDTSRKLDTCLVRYTLKNVDNRRHEAGMRFLLDTFIGANDGTPFTIPGSPDLCDSMRDFKTADQVPDYLEALENEDLANPGTVAHLRLKLGNKIEAPNRVTLGHWPNQRLNRLSNVGARDQLTLWDVPLLPMRLLYDSFPRVKWEDGKRIEPDSAVTMYWDPKPLEPGQTRVVGFAYGLGQVASKQSKGKLLLTVGGRLVRNSEFTLTALVAQPAAGETLTLELPPGLQTQGEMKQDVPQPPPGSARPISTLTWKLTATTAGTYPVKVTSSRGMVETTTVTIRSQGVFD
jgi:hypothetical protein